jgi:hypothetical protein
MRTTVSAPSSLILVTAGGLSGGLAVGADNGLTHKTSRSIIMKARRR